MATSPYPIDFVTMWVDGADPAWVAERNAYAAESSKGGIATNRFRDWGLMRYWFRGIEKFAPWVRTVHFVTCGQCPEWLDTSHPKLHLVRHEDYIPTEYLPVFNSSAIEIFFNRIEGLAEHFVEFNDDTFLVSPTTEEDFFKDGLPCDCALLGTINSANIDDSFPHIVLNNMAVINAHFDKAQVLRDHRSLFLSPLYGKDILRNLALWNTSRFSCFYDLHQPSSHRKSTWDKVWSEEGEILELVGNRRFRSEHDLTQWLFKGWQICEGAIVPRSSKWSKFLVLGESPEVHESIASGKHKCVCLNDENPSIDYEAIKAELVAAFERILPERSSFERR